MTLTQMLEAMIYVVPIMAVLIGALWLVIRKQNKTKEALEAALTQEQKDRLLQTQATPVQEDQGSFVIEALVVELKDKGEKLFVRLMFHNTVIPNNCYDKLMMANVKVSKAEADAHGLKVGDYVRFRMNPEKQKWDVVF